MKRNLTMLMDYYQLTMANVYYESELRNKEATFDLFFRRVPDKGSYAVFCGLENMVDYINNFKFSSSDIRYLRKEGIFTANFLKYLKDLRLKINVVARKEGSVIFPGEPVLTVRGNIIEAQIIETALLNIFNHETLIATKGNRLKEAVGEKIVLEFGCRRAHGADAAVNGARAAHIAGIDGTSNLYAGRRFGIPCGGTMAHSMVKAFPTEYEAFKHYAKIFPNNCVLLVDTYDVLKSGMSNAIKVFKELRARGYTPKGVRLDSGSLLELSTMVRKMLDKKGFPNVKIYATNSLDEFEIARLEKEGKIDAYGAGERLITAKSEPVFGGVYKLTTIDGISKIKLSEELGKTTNPGKKNLYRLYNKKSSLFDRDLITLKDENIDDLIDRNEWDYEELLIPIFKDGVLVYKKPQLQEIRNHLLNEKARLSAGYKQLEYNSPPPVELSKKLKQLKEELIIKYKTDMQNQKEKILI